MNIYETALLCGIQRRPSLKEDKPIVKRCESPDLQTSLKNLVEAQLVEFHDSHIDNVTSIFEELKDRYPNIKTIFDDALQQVDNTVLLQYVPTDKGKEWIESHTYLKDYMSAETLPEGMTIDTYCATYDKSLEEFNKNFFTRYLADTEK